MIKTEPSYKSKRVFCWVSDKVSVKDTKKYGMGLFANSKIKKDEKIAMFGGYVMTRKEEDSTPSDIYDNAIQIDDNLVIGTKNKDEIEDAAMLNHCCSANTGVKGQILLVAIKDIEPGEQVTLDFSTVLFHPKGVKPYRLKCLCGDKECRGIITDNDWKKKAIQVKYKGHFPLHIQEKIDKISK
jgi:hypothetical protein